MWELLSPQAKCLHLGLTSLFLSRRDHIWKISSHNQYFANHILIWTIFLDIRYVWRYSICFFKNSIFGSNFHGSKVSNKFNTTCEDRPWRRNFGAKIWTYFIVESCDFINWQKTLTNKYSSCFHISLILYISNFLHFPFEFMYNKSDRPLHYHSKVHCISLISSFL